MRADCFLPIWRNMFTRKLWPYRLYKEPWRPAFSATHPPGFRTVPENIQWTYRLWTGKWPGSEWLLPAASQNTGQGSFLILGYGHRYMHPSGCQIQNHTPVKQTRYPNIIYIQFVKNPLWQAFFACRFFCPSVSCRLTKTLTKYCSQAKYLVSFQNYSNYYYNISGWLLQINYCFIYLY